ncbi:MAG TPA: lipopolysaccharide biosynthesis protein [Oligoflexia bacterium]|nr:lipopolysaccharide biosynthesis protein [Oligoflexia bacterium]HMP47046.1 lipopolysaccharide biosynthesis protein [Oligoflexia bacterium]
MPLINQAIVGASWLSLFKLVSQAISWTATILVARLLSSADYGLMEMATIFTGYIGFFVEFGIGTALINKDSINKQELSSVFWFLIAWGLILAAACLGLAPVTAQFFAEPRLLPLTAAVGILFIISSATIVPRSILHRELRFKEVGIIEVINIIIASVTMIICAYLGAGPWTLLAGHIAREVSNLTLLTIRTRFIPLVQFSLSQIASLLHFGAPVALSTSLYYIYTKSDRFFGGRSFGAEELGYYAVGLQLAAIPVEKIVSLLQSVLYPTLSKLKHKPEYFNEVYLGFVSALALITFPLFIGGVQVAPEAVIVILGEKWQASILPLQILLISQLIMTLSAPNGLIHAARGKPKWNLIFNLALTPTLVIAFYFSAKQPLIYQLAIPWITVYPVFQIAYIIITNRELKITGFDYLSRITHPLIACSLMSVSIWLVSYLFFQSDNRDNLLYLGVTIITGALVYGIYFLTLGRGLVSSLKKLKDMDL